MKICELRLSYVIHLGRFKNENLDHETQKSLKIKRFVLKDDLVPLERLNKKEYQKNSKNTTVQEHYFIMLKNCFVAIYSEVFLSYSSYEQEL